MKFSRVYLRYEWEYEKRGEKSRKLLTIKFIKLVSVQAFSIKNMVHLPIRQEDDFWCGFACVAFLLHISYKEVFQYFDNPEKAKLGKYRCKFLLDALKKWWLNNYRTTYIGRKPEYSIPNNSIVYVNKNKKYRFWHYLVKNQNWYMNPFFNIDTEYWNAQYSVAQFEEVPPWTISLVIHPLGGS